jgi:deoxyribodipyrimidine photo-lyase
MPLRSFRCGGGAIEKNVQQHRVHEDGVPAIRVSEVGQRPVRKDGAFVLLWMIGARRVRHNFALERAIAWARELDRPLVVLEPLRCDYPYASDRFHRFVIEGMRDHAQALEQSAVTYVPWIERAPHEGKDMLAAYAAHACLIVSDLSGVPWLRGMLDAAAQRVSIRVETVDGLGILPIRASSTFFLTAHSFRRFLQKNLPAHLARVPAPNPLRSVRLRRLEALPSAITSRWPMASRDELEDPSALIARLPIDHTIGAVPERGGGVAATALLREFVRDRLPRYAERNHPDADVCSRLSGHLHFGHISPHEMLDAIARETDWNPARLSAKATGSREGWWNASPAADEFLDQLVTWRELAHMRAIHDRRVMEFSSIPDWARRSLAMHEKDARPAIYDRAQLIRAETGDEVWNAAQRQLLSEGRIHNYVRMLWGKLVLAWQRTPEEAFMTLIDLNDRYSIDGRDPNSWANIAWIFGSYDRPWGPERPIYGTVRYMTSDSAKRKLRMKEWLRRWSATGGQLALHNFAYR